MAGSKISKKLQREISEALQSRSATREELDKATSELISDFQDSAKFKAAQQFIEQQRESIVKSNSARAYTMSRQLVAPDTPFHLRQSIMKSFSSGLHTFAGAQTMQNIAAAQTSFDQVDFYAKRMQSINMPMEIRKEASQRVLGELSGYAPPLRITQAGEVFRRMSEREMLGEFRKTELIRDPELRRATLVDLQERAREFSPSGSRLSVGIGKAIGSVEDQIQKSQERAEKERVRSEKFVSEQLSRGRDTRVASTVADQVRAAGSPTAAMDVLERMRSESPGERTLKEIERLTKEQNSLINRDVKNFEDAQRQFPVLTALMAGGGGGGPGGGPGMLSPQQYGRIASTANVLSAVGQGIGVAASTYGAFLDSGVRVQEKTFLNIASTQALRAKQNLELMTGFSGDAILKQYGDLFLNSREGTFLGLEGRNRARVESATSVQQERDKETRWGMYSGLAAGAGALALGAAFAPVTGGLSLALGTKVALGVGGAAALGGGLSTLFSNRAVRATGIFGEERQKEAESSYGLLDETISQNLINKDVDANKLYSQAFQGAIDIREAESQAMAMTGARTTSFRAALSDRYERSILGLNPAADITTRVAAGITDQGTLIDRAISLGMDPKALTLAVAKTGISVDSRFRGDATATTLRLRELELSGRGSMSQLQGNLSALNRLSGAGDSDKQLEDILAKGVARGFQGSRMSQEFAGAVLEGMARTRSADQERVSERVGAMSALFGGGERGLGFAKESFGKVDAFGQNRLVEMVSRAATVQAAGGMGSLTNQAFITDQLMAMPLNQRMGALGDVQKVISGKMKPSQLSPEAKELYYAVNRAGDPSKAVKALYAAQLEGTLGSVGGLEEFKQAMQEATKGQKVTSENVFGFIQEAAQKTGASGLIGYSTSALAQLLIGADDPAFRNILDPLRAANKSAVDKESVSKYVNINKFKANSARARAQLTGAGESRFASTLRKDLFAANLGMQQGATISQLAERAGIDLSALGADLGTGLMPDTVNKMLNDPEVAKEILWKAGAGGFDMALRGAGRSEEETENITKLASVLGQSRYDLANQQTFQQARAMGVTDVSLTEITDGSITKLASAISRAVRPPEYNNHQDPNRGRAGSGVRISN